ncbi:MAG: hypothetical protein WAQ57_00830 [Candidatus Saccharimonadales bacterium]
MPKKTTAKKSASHRRTKAKRSGAVILFGAFGLALCALLLVKFLVANYTIVTK